MLRDTGCLFVISAVESVDDTVLEFSTKVTRAKISCTSSRLSANLAWTLHPTFVPFTPWTTLDGYLDLLDVLQEQALVENVAPIQLGIRLLIPEGSRMLELEDVRRMVGPLIRSRWPILEKRRPSRGCSKRTPSRKSRRRRSARKKPGGNL